MPTRLNSLATIFLACATWTFGAFAQSPAIGVLHHCDGGNDIRIASCANSVCDVELGPPGRLEPYLRMAPAGAAAFLAAQHCVAPDGQPVAAAARPAPIIDKPLTTPERPPEPSRLGSVVLRLALVALLAGIVWPLIARIRKTGRGEASTISSSGSSTGSHGSFTQAAKTTCNSCSGRGNVTCPQCRGRRGEWGNGGAWQACWSCGGSGEARCSVCNGSGYS